MKEDINTFKDELIDILEEKLDPGYIIRNDIVTKNNDVKKTGISIQKGIEEINVSPTVYIEDLYEKYNGYNINAIAEEAYNLYPRAGMHRLGDNKSCKTGYNIQLQQAP